MSDMSDMSHDAQFDGHAAVQHALRAVLSEWTHVEWTHAWTDADTAARV